MSAKPFTIIYHLMLPYTIVVKFNVEWKVHNQLLVCNVTVIAGQTISPWNKLLINDYTVLVFAHVINPPPPTPEQLC